MAYSPTKKKYPKLPPRSVVVVSRYTDLVDGLKVEVDRVIACDLGGLVDSAAAGAAAPAAVSEEAVMVVGQVPEAEASAKGVGEFYEAVVELYPTRIHANNEAPESVLNGEVKSTSHFGEEDDDTDTDDYTFVEISVYEVQEVIQQTPTCQTALEEDRTVKFSECVAVLTKLLPGDKPDEDSLVLDGCSEDINGNVIHPLLLLTNDNNGKRRRGRGSRSHSRRRRNRNRR